MTPTSAEVPRDPTLRRVAEEAAAELSEMGGRLLQLIAAELPELAGDARVRELLAATIVDSLGAALAMVRSGTPASGLGAPPVALEFARRLAQQGVPITAMLRGYRLGQAAFQQEMITRIGVQDVSAGEVAAAASDLSAVAFGFIDRISEEIVAAYQLERDGWMRQRNATLLATVTGVLDGRTTDTASLHYPVAGPHVALVLWADTGTEESTRLQALERHLGRITAAAGCRAPLVVAPDASTLWAWLPIGHLDVAQVPADEVTTAIGEPGEGLAGFRTSHAGARQAQHLALAAAHGTPPRVVTAAGTGPLALLGADVTAAAAWVQSVLGPLATDDDVHARMRETVWAYLAAGASLTTAAAELHLHKNTIQYRIRKAEDARGRPLHDGRLDVEVALLACRILGATVLAAP